MFRNILFSLIALILFIPDSLASENSAYNFSWLDPDKEVYVLQNRKFRKSGRVHFNAGYGMTTSGAFVDGSVLQGRVGFFFAEEWGLEFLYAQNKGKENDAFDLAVNDGGSGTIPFRRITQGYMGGLLLWSPFYAKINTFNKIVYLDWILALGYGKLTEKNNKATVVAGSATPLADNELDHNAFIWGTALKFYMTRYFHARVDLTGLYYEAEKAKTVATSGEKAWYSHYDLTFSLGLDW